MTIQLVALKKEAFGEGILAKMKNEVLTFLQHHSSTVQAEEPMTVRGETLSP